MGATRGSLPEPERMSEVASIVIVWGVKLSEPILGSRAHDPLFAHRKLDSKDTHCRTTP